VIAVARQGDQSIAAVAPSLGISEFCLARWSKTADREDDMTSGSIDTPARPGERDLEAENRDLRKRAKQLEQPVGLGVSPPDINAVARAPLDH